MTDNPLSVIFKLKNKTELQDEIQSIVNIKNFFNYITNEKIQEKLKIKVLQKLLAILKTNRYICEYFSTYDNKSIYIYLFDLFLDPKSSPNFKSSIIDLMNELLLNIETNKTIYEYLFQKLSIFYHNENINDPILFTNLLILLKTIICSEDLIQDPLNYFSFSGNGKLSLDLSNENQKLQVGYCMTFILNFKIGNSSFYEGEDDARVSNLINLKFSNGSKISIDLQYPGFLKIKEEKEKMIKVLPTNELINLIISIVVDNSDTLQLYNFVNGENNLISYKFKNNLKRVQDYFETVEFFNNFYGEVISITMLRQDNEGILGSNSTQLLTMFKDFKEGIWKKKQLNKFLDYLNSINSNIAPSLNDKLLGPDVTTKKIYKNKDKVLSPKLRENIIFIFTPYNYYQNCGIIDDYFGKYKLNIMNNKQGFIRNHRYQFYQKKLYLVCDISNFLPIAEMFLFRNQLLNEENIVLYLNIIENIINDKRINMFSIQECQFFKILCILFEKLPNNIFTEKILNALIHIGKIMLSNQLEDLNAQYFTHILLNERIISKFSDNLQIKFWNQILLFCQSDSSQMQSFINMNRICLILRSYDKSKYSEMCCETHLKMFLDEYNESKKIMEPIMPKKLSYIGGIMEYLINTQEPSWVLSLFKLLTLDLSPCLTKFIINIVNKALFNHNLEDQKVKEIWFKEFIEQLISAKYDVILINTFIHSLLDVRIDILKFLYQLSLIFSQFNKLDEIAQWRNVLTKIILPQQMFYNIDKNKKETLVIKEFFYKDYIEKVICFILLWSVEENYIADDAISYIDPKKFEARKFYNVSILEVAFDLLSKINYETELCTKFISSLNAIIKNNNGNSFEFLYNKDVFMSSLDLVYNTFLAKISDTTNDKPIQIKKGFIFNSGKAFVSALFLNSVSFLEFNLEGNYPMSLIDYIFSWQDKLIMNNNDENKFDELKNNINSFINEIIGTLLQDYYLKFYIKMCPKEKEFKDISKNFEVYYYQYNYFLLINKILTFGFECQFNDLILQNKISPLENNVNDLYLSLMRKDNNEKNTTISQIWKDFNFFQQIYDRVKYIFQRGNFYGELDKKLKIKNKVWRYIDLIENLLIKKEKKNLFKKQICFLCYYDNYVVNSDNIKDKSSYITSSLIKYIEFSLMGIISILIEKQIQTGFEIWLKYFSHLLKFTIIASANLWTGEKNDEKDILFTEKTLNKIQEQCALIIYNGFSFLTKIYKTSPICTDKIQKTILSIFTLSFTILNYQYAYNKDHKINNRTSFKSRNPYDSLYNSAIFLLFEEYLGKNKDTKDKKYFLSRDAVNNLVNEENYENNIISFIKDPKWDEIFLDNNEMNEIISEKLCRLPEYKAFVQQKYEISKVNIEKTNNSQFIQSNENILKLLPLYEKELIQYSNNSLEQNIQKKNIYKIQKKKMFSWNGFWSERSLFYPNENEQNTHRLKYKLINHYTKSFMKPVLVPILDISYYLPDFSGFNPDNIFNSKNKPVVNMDIDKINKATESNKEILDNVKNNYLRDVYVKSNAELAQKLLTISNSLDFGKEEEFSILENNKEEDNSIYKKKCFLSCLVKTSHHIKGVCFVDEDDINFKVFLNQKTGNAMSGVNIGFTDKDEDYDPERKTCFGSYFMFHHKDKDLYNISIKYNEIKLVLKRRYYYKNSAIEIFTSTNKSYYFNFKFEEDRESFIVGILEKIKNLKPIVNDLREGKDNILGYENTYLIKKKFKRKDREKMKEKQKTIQLSKRLRAWTEWKINNFKFLMWLNIIGNRSYNDISQYPIFPWTLSSYTDPLKFDLDNSDVSFNALRKSLKLPIMLKKAENDPTHDYYRDMKSPMGMLEINEESKKRKESFIELYDIMKSSPDEFEGTKPYYYGTNYSNPVYVCNYLIRLFPFTHISIELQGNKLDDANRLFLSVEKSFYNSTTQKTDLRELIPEFFYLPEMFININDVNLGKEENGNIVNDVITPCNNNPYTFIENMKRVFESINISYSLNNWVDLIFGYKVRGKESENAKNIYTEASYQENIDLKSIEDKSAYLRYVEFGLIPEQVMDKECMKRKRKVDMTRGKEITEYNVTNSTKLKINTIKHDNSIDKNCKFFDKQFQKFTVLKTALLTENRFISLLNNNYVIETEIGYLSEDLLNYIKIPEMDNRISDNITRNINNKIIQFYGAGDYIILGGYYDGKISIVNKNNKRSLELHPFNEEKPIISTAIDENEEYLVVGNTLGNIAVYKIGMELNEWADPILIITQTNSVSDIHINSNLNLFATASLDGIINVYTLPICKLVRSIKVKCQKCSNVFLSESTLPSIIIIAEIKDNSDELLSYSINGKLITEFIENKIFSPILFSDRNSYEYLAYLSEGYLTVRNLPSLSTQFVIDGIPSLSTILLDEDKKSIFGFNEDGTQIIAIRD